MTLPKLYAIADKATLDARGMGVVAFARDLRDAGVTLVQYRDKQGGPQEILSAAAEISAVFAGVEALLVLNDRADLAVLAGWDGVHVGQGDLAVVDARRVLGIRPTLATIEPSRRWGTRSRGTTTARIGGVVGVSTHDQQQVLRCARDNKFGGADYIAVGPVFRTASKANAEPVVGLEGVRRARALTTKPLVSIGGITRENARSVIEAGADAVAVIGGLLTEKETVEKVARDFLELLR